MLDGIFSKICLVMGIIMIIMGVEIYTQHLRLVNYETKEKAAATIGESQNRKAKQDDANSKAHKNKVEEEYAKVITNLHVDNQRMRQQLTSRSKLPTAPQVCTSPSERTEIDWPLIESAINEYRQEVAGLVEQGDQATAALNAIKMWVEKEAVEG